MIPFSKKGLDLALPDSPLATPAITAMEPEAVPPPALPAGSRRKRLWELKHQHHCPVIGTCLPLDLLRKLALRAKILTPGMSDFALHTQAVGFSEQRTPFAELMQQELERRYNLTVQRFRSARAGDEVYRLWREAVALGQVADALWAAWTHPRCDSETAQRIYGDIHMLSHQAGAAHQADVNRLKRLEVDNAALKAELAVQRERGGQRLAEKVQETELLKRQLAEMEVFACEREALGQRVIELEARLRAQDGSESGQRSRADALALRLVSAEDRANAAEARVRDLQQQLEEHRSDLRAAEQAMESWLLLDGEPDAGDHACALSAACGQSCGRNGSIPRLEGRNVLCVGGRPGLVETYRRLVERLGGRFAHHDGGLEDNPRVLDGVLSAADAVICQAGCISHGAYWKLKDHCKRKGKPCVYLKGAGVSSFVRGISEVAEGPVEPS